MFFALVRQFYFDAVLDRLLLNLLLCQRISVK
jgi:hypothetical protein